MPNNQITTLRASALLLITSLAGCATTEALLLNTDRRDKGETGYLIKTKTSIAQITSGTRDRLYAAQYCKGARNIARVDFITRFYLLVAEYEAKIYCFPQEPRKTQSQRRKEYLRKKRQKQ